MTDLVEWSNDQSERLIAKVTESVDRVFNPLEAKLDQYAISGLYSPDDDSQPPPSRH
jgi:hypothetical protein